MFPVLLAMFVLFLRLSSTSFSDDPLTFLLLKCPSNNPCPFRSPALHVHHILAASSLSSSSSASPPPPHHLQYCFIRLTLFQNHISAASIYLVALLTVQVSHPSSIPDQTKHLSSLLLVLMLILIFVRMLDILVKFVLLMTNLLFISALHRPSSLTRLPDNLNSVTCLTIFPLIWILTLTCLSLLSPYTPFWQCLSYGQFSCILHQVCQPSVNSLRSQPPM